MSRPRYYKQKSIWQGLSLLPPPMKGTCHEDQDQDQSRNDSALLITFFNLQGCESKGDPRMRGSPFSWRNQQSIEIDMVGDQLLDQVDAFGMFRAKQGFDIVNGHGGRIGILTAKEYGYLLFIEH